MNNGRELEKSIGIVKTKLFRLKHDADCSCVDCFGYKTLISLDVL